jgi:hypothetical protein
MTYNWKEIARSERQAAAERFAEAKQSAVKAPLLESLRRAHEYISSLQIRIIRARIPEDQFGITEKGDKEVQIPNFEGFLRILHEIKCGVCLTQAVPKDFQVMLQGYSSVPLVVIGSEDTAEKINNLTRAIMDWRSRTESVIDLADPIISAIGRVLPQILTFDPHDNTLSNRLTLTKEITDAYVARQLILNIAENIHSDELAAIRSQSGRSDSFLRLEYIGLRTIEIEESTEKYYSDLQTIQDSLYLFQDRLKELKQQNGQDDPNAKKDLKDCHKTISQLRSEIAKLNKRIIAATAERSGLLREKIALVCPRASAQLRAQSEMSKAEPASFQDEPAEPAVAEPVKPIERTPRETNDFMIANFPRLYARLMQRTSEEIEKGRLALERRMMKKEMRRLVRGLSSAGIPDSFISERINAGQKDAESIISQYIESQQTATAPGQKSGAKVIQLRSVPVAQKPKVNKTEITEKTLRHLLNQLIYARFGVNSVDALSKAQKDILNKKMDAVLSFIREYIDYLKQPKKTRGAFMGSTTETKTTFTENFWTNVSNPGGWRAFSAQAGSSARITICVRPENEEISLLMIEPNHDIYTATLARFNHERDIQKRVFLSAENERVLVSVRNGSK